MPQLALAMRSLLGPLLAALLFLAPIAAAEASPAMWEVSDAKQHKVWLFGSIHALPNHVDWRTPAFDKVLAAAPQVYFETDIGPLGVMALTVKMLALGFEGLHNSWVKQLTSDQLHALQTAIAPLGLTLDQLDRFPPWVAELQIEEGAITSGGADKGAAGRGVDIVLQAELPKERKAFFETAGQDFDLLADDPIDVQISRLFAALSDPDTNAATGFDDLVKEWEGGDLDTIAATLKPESPDDAARTQKLLFDRNRNWVPTIEGLLRDGQDDLIVVGAAHLAGGGSVIDLLTQAGYTVTRVQ